MLAFIPGRRINAFSFNALTRGREVCRQGVISLDRLLRHRQKIVTDPGQDLLRIAIRGWSAEPVPLEDRAVHAGDRVIELHLWNERLAAIGRFGPGLRWGARMRRRLLRSFALLAARLEADPALTGCVAIRAEIVLPDRRIAKLARLAGRFGFRQQGEATSPGLGRSLLALALAWTFNPGSLKPMRLKPAGAIFWVSVPTFLARYRQASIATPRRQDSNLNQRAQVLSRQRL